MSQSIPNLKSFTDMREAEMLKHGSIDPNYSFNLKKPEFEQASGKKKNKEDNYKRNLYAAMTSRVLRQ